MPVKCQLSASLKRMNAGKELGDCTRAMRGASLGLTRLPAVLHETSAVRIVTTDDLPGRLKLPLYVVPAARWISSPPTALSMATCNPGPSAGAQMVVAGGAGIGGTGGVAFFLILGAWRFHSISGPGLPWMEIPVAASWIN